MNKLAYVFIILFYLINASAQAMTCPDPNNSSLQWGVPPEPWEINPFSPNKPQGEPNTRFARANILIAGLGRGVSCTYRISIGEYSIWLPALVRIPSRTEPNWIDSYGGKVCTQSLTECEFTVAY